MNNNQNISIRPEIIVKLMDEAKSAGFTEKTWAVFSDQAKLDTVIGRLSDELVSLVDKATLLINDPAYGLATIDIPEIDSEDVATNMWLGSLFAVVFSKAVYDVKIDHHTGLPFTIYNASNLGAKLLKQNGIKYYSPEQILGYHTDGVVAGSGLASPKYVSIYNVFLGYRKPGNFHWIPFQNWTEFGKWKQTLADKRFNLEITPITYRKGDDELEVVSEGKYEVSVIAKTEDGLQVPFFNGEIMSCASDSEFDIERIKQMQKSLSLEKNKISIPIKARRLFLLNNWLGAHARDIFEDQVEGLNCSRSFFRSMSKELLAV